VLQVQGAAAKPRPVSARERSLLLDRDFELLADFEYAIRADSVVSC